MVLLRAMSMLGLIALASLVTLTYGDPLIEEFPRLYENFMSIFESLGGRRYLEAYVEAIQNGEDVTNLQTDQPGLQDFFGDCLREIVTSDIPFLRPDIQTGYEKVKACTGTGCGANEIRFTQAVNNADFTDFRYAFDGPVNLQGTWWIKNNQTNAPRGAVLMNFAKSLDPTPLSPGAVLPPGPDGVNFLIRVAGDRTFAFSTDGLNGGVGDSAFDQTIRQDLIYDYAQQPFFDPFNPGGPSLAEVEELFVFPTFKVPGFPCVRIRFRPCLFFIYSMRMTIAAPSADNFPNSTFAPNSKIWNLEIKQFGNVLASFKYIQVVDGTGAILPAYNAFAAEQLTNPVPGDVFFRARRDNQPLVICGGGI